ncbi:MAG TPA: AMP-binding protein [Gemmatimonadaceae bacterium]|nr:AMP-binding protein [Gemmatimonadaceae bacterium]
MNLTTLFDLSLIGRHDRPALEYSTPDGTLATLRFGDIEHRANRMAHELRARGLERGDRLCVHLANRVEFIDVFLACARLGAIFVPMNVLYRERELRHIVGDADPTAVVTSASTHVDYPAEARTWEIDDLSADARLQPHTRIAEPLSGDDPAMIVYTSGTTGAAKGAVLSHGNLAANAVNLVACWRISEADRYLAMLPLFHVHGLGNGVHSWLVSGCLMRLCERFDQNTAAAIFADFKPTLFFGVPTIYVRLLDADMVNDMRARDIGKHARLFVCGSAPLPAHVLQAFERRYGHRILERYGMSEALMILSNPYEGERRAGTVGFPLPGVSVRLVSSGGDGGEDGHDCAADEVGEVRVRSPALFSGYWRREDATREAFVDGWFRTGDLGARSADGYYTLRGRRGDLIISGGFNIYPREIEELLLEDPRVREAAVVGAPDDVRGEVPIAYIVADASLDVRELTDRCRSQLASFKAPRAFVRVDALPRTALGKVQKHLLPPWIP